MADNTSSVGNDLARLYNDINKYQVEVDTASEKLKKAKSDFASYLKEAGIDKLLAPTQPDLFGNTDGNGVTSAGTRKPRTSSADKAAGVERNRAIYTGSYPLGLDDKTGLPKKYKGRGSANDAINAQMADDERDYAARQDGGSAGGEETPEGTVPSPEQPVAPARQSGKPKGK